MNDHAFVISLARATTRAANARRMLDRLPISGELLPAVDGRELTSEQIASVFQREVHQPRYPFELKANEIGCFLSHRAAWQEIVDRDLDAALILEDDAVVDLAAMEQTIAFMRALKDEAGYVQFPVRSVPESAITLRQEGGQTICRTKITLLRTSGQWVTRPVAESLLKATGRFDRPVDTTLQMHWITGVRCHTLVPSPIRDAGDELGGSTISGKKKRRLTLDKVRREVSRAVYRNAVARLSRRHDQDATSAKRAA